MRRTLAAADLHLPAVPIGRLTHGSDHAQRPPLDVGFVYVRNV
jgi:hypothetical protein